MYHVSAQGVDERMINVHYYYYYLSHTSEQRMANLTVQNRGRGGE